MLDARAHGEPHSRAERADDGDDGNPGAVRVDWTRRNAPGEHVSWRLRIGKRRARTPPWLTPAQGFNEGNERPEETIRTAHAARGDDGGSAALPTDCA